jgi:peptide-methionine (R)-S-oxide reductase
VDRDLARNLVVSLAWSRVALGLTLFVAPTVPLRPWVGRAEARRPQAKLLGRSLGARDLALGLGMLIAQKHGSPLRGWVEAAGVADAGDMLGTFFGWGHLPKASRLFILASAGGAVAVARLTSTAVDAQS